MSSAREIDTNNCCIIQVTNISPSCTALQVETLFSLLGHIEELHLYPKEETSVVSCRSCCVRYSTPEEARLAMHLTGTVFIDRAMTVGHPRFETIASDRQISYSELMSPERYRRNHRGDSPLTSRSDPVMQDEIRRTIYVGNLAHETTAEQVMKFFVGCGEIKFVRMAGDQSQATRFAFLEFTDPNSITQAIQMNGAIFGDRPLKVNYSKKAIVKPSNASRLDPSSKESEVLMRVQAASRFISEVVGSREESRSRSRERRRHGHTRGHASASRSPEHKSRRTRSRSPRGQHSRSSSCRSPKHRDRPDRSDREERGHSPRSSERRNGQDSRREEKASSRRAHGHKDRKSEHSESSSRRREGKHSHLKESPVFEESPHRHKSKSKRSKKHKHHQEERSSSGKRRSKREETPEMEY